MVGRDASENLRHRCLRVCDRARCDRIHIQAWCGADIKSNSDLNSTVQMHITIRTGEPCLGAESTRSCIHHGLLHQQHLHTTSHPDQSRATPTPESTGERRDGYRDHVLYSMALATGSANTSWPASRSATSSRRMAGEEEDRSPRVQAQHGAQTQQEVIVPPELRAKLEKSWAGKNGSAKASHRTRPSSRATGAHLYPPGRYATGSRLAATSGIRPPRELPRLRHSACSAIYRKTKDIRLTQRFARHKSILTTAVYSHPTDEDWFARSAGLPC